MGKGSIAVPDVVGLTFASAFSIGSTAGLVVVGYGPDGTRISPDSEGIVVEQDPMSPGTIKVGRDFRLRVGRGDGGSKDPEPRRPDPMVRRDRADISDPDEDLDLVPA